MAWAEILCQTNFSIKFKLYLRKWQNVLVYKTCLDRNFCHPQLIQVQSNGSWIYYKKKNLILINSNSRMKQSMKVWELYVEPLYTKTKILMNNWMAWCKTNVRFIILVTYLVCCCAWCNRKLKCAHFWNVDGNRKWAIFTFTCFHTTTFTMLRIFSPLEMISMKIWETIWS